LGDFGLDRFGFAAENPPPFGRFGRSCGGCLSMTNSLCRRLDRDAPLPMFVASVATLLLLAGEIHFSHGKMFAPLLSACHIGLALVWPLFVLEALVHVYAQSARWKQHLAFCLCPPLRLSARDACTGEQVWLPRLGWVVADRDLEERLERALNVPMILIALCVVPLLALDYYQPEHHPLVHHLHDAIVHSSAAPAPPPSPSLPTALKARLGPVLVWAQRPDVRFATRIGEALIWTAFALEFAVMISVVERKLKYCVKHWIDIAVIVLPLVAFLRSLRMVRLARLNQIGKFTRVYRLRGSVVRAQKGLVVASVVERKLLRNPKKQLAKLQESLAEKERDLEALRTRIRELQLEIERQDHAPRRVA
jgi:hypothetical protein